MKDFVRIPVRGIVSSPIEVFPRFVLIEPNKAEYNIFITLYNKAELKLISYKFESNGLDLLSCGLDAEKAGKLVVGIKRQYLHKGFVTGKLLLKYDKELEPVEIKFVSPDTYGDEK